MNKSILSLVFTIISITLAFAQTQDTTRSKTEIIASPIPIEAFSTDKGLLMQMTVAKKLQSNSKLGMFALTEYYADYNNEKEKHKYLIQTFLTYDLGKGFSIIGGGAINQASGFRPTIGVQYIYAKNDIFALIIPRVDLTETNNLEAFGFVEYTPKINEKLGIYTRVQGVYNHNPKDNLHDISYIRLRAGLSYQNFQFGLGANFAQYGPLKINENSYGIFVRALIF